MEAPEGRRFYGSVTVSERGQLVIPGEAGKDFNINTGNKLLVFGDVKTGLWIATSGVLEENSEGSAELSRNIASQMEKPGID
jgi:bifunctional DNA-binding transcriptional regulator/antitoxin component of YhaV-PrlF toxin-antitoxin module